MSVGVFLEIYQKKVTQIVLPKHKLFIQIENTKQYWIECIICGGYYIHLCLWNFTQPRIVIPFRRFGTTHQYQFQDPNNPIVLTERSFWMYIHELPNVILNIVIV